MINVTRIFHQVYAAAVSVAQMSIKNVIFHVQNVDLQQAVFYREKEKSYIDA